MNEQVTFPPLNTLMNWPAYQTFDGRLGVNRERQKHCQIKAEHDLEAIYCWLNEYAHIPTTYRHYQKEAERFLIWVILQQRKPLSSVEREDLDAYQQFLAHPFPKDKWCAPKGAKRGSPQWRPFVGGLSERGQETALAILKSLFMYLTEAHYLAYNPFQLVRRRKKQEGKRQLSSRLSRILEDDEWGAILNALEALSEDEVYQQFYKQRLKMIIYLLYFTGLRVEELVNCKWQDFRKIRNEWWLFVVGKGSKEGTIPINDELFIALAEYRLFLGKTLEPNEEEIYPVITRWEKKDEPLTARRVNMLLKDLGSKAAKQFIDQPLKLKRLARFSAHWIRHLSATMQDRVGIKDKYIQANHRHESMKTTYQYIHLQQEARYKEMKKLRLKMKGE